MNKENKGDLISRRVLKGLISDKSIPIKFEEEKRGEWQNSSGVLLSDIYKIIDNAPTITDHSVEIAQKSIELGRRVGRAEGAIENQRPQGEWVYGEDECGQDGWFCSECGFFVPWYYLYYENDIDFIREYKACPHCLAEMITYTGKDRDAKGGAE